MLGVAMIELARRKRARQRDVDFFAGKNVLLTGGSRGLGFVLARHLLEAGARVAVCGRSAESIAAVRDKFAEFGASLRGIVCDVRDTTACTELVRRVEADFGSIDVLINNAGIIAVGPFENQTIDDYRAALETHFWAPLATTLAVLPAMRARRGGRILNVASVGGIVGVPHLAAYSASKFAQIGLTHALAAEVARDGVRMTAIIPGLMRTGSPDHANFSGQHRAEYAWFTLSDANPLISVSADDAARRIMRAARRGDAQAIIGYTAQAARIVSALFPQSTAALLGWAAALLPAATGDGTVNRPGAQSHSAWTENGLTALNRRAMRDANQRQTPS